MLRIAVKHAVETTLADLRNALRHRRRAPLLASLTILTRGLGIGKRLVRECTRFAREAGYERITLWTNSVLDAARHLYVKEGYRLVAETPHHSFGHDLVGQTWELELKREVGSGRA